jgi:hypothetical protein
MKNRRLGLGWPSWLLAGTWLLATACSPSPEAGIYFNPQGAVEIAPISRERIAFQAIVRTGKQQVHYLSGQANLTESGSYRHLSEQAQLSFEFRQGQIVLQEAAQGKAARHFEGIYDYVNPAHIFPEPATVLQTAQPLARPPTYPAGPAH